MAKINAIGNKSGDLTIDPGASGDSFLQFDISATGEFRIGVDDTDADKFKISQGNALGANDTFEMTAAGERIMDLQPAFLGRLPSDVDNVTGDGTEFTLGTTVAFTEIFDQNNDFNVNGTFTAPITGRYLLKFVCRMHDIVAGMTESQGTISTSNRDYISDLLNVGVAVNAFTQYYTHVQAFVDMDASDTAVAKVKISNGAKSVDIDGDGTELLTWFCGYLVC